MTDLELNRTQTEYDDSLALKIYLLQFINYYASIFYIAFFKVSPLFFHLIVFTPWLALYQ